jgi:hypothetical protein
MTMDPNTDKPTTREVTNYSVGLALGVIVTWGLELLVVVPATVGAAIGTLCVFLAWRLNFVRGDA